MLAKAYPMLSGDEHPTHCDQERPRQGKGHMLLMPTPGRKMAHAGPTPCRERLEGLLKYY